MVTFCLDINNPFSQENRQRKMSKFSSETADNFLIGKRYFFILYVMLIGYSQDKEIKYQFQVKDRTTFVARLAFTLPIFKGDGSSRIMDEVKPPLPTLTEPICV